jgi:hypothetical protein
MGRVIQVVILNLTGCNDALPVHMICCRSPMIGVKVSNDDVRLERAGVS